MVIRPRHLKTRALIMVEMIMAIAILFIAALPLAFTIHADAKVFKATYQRAVAMEIVDGEMEILAAGGWQSVSEGTHPYTVRAAAAANLPDGQFKVTRAGRHLRLEWLSNKHIGIGPVMREADVK